MERLTNDELTAFEDTLTDPVFDMPDALRPPTLCLLAEVRESRKEIAQRQETERSLTDWVAADGDTLRRILELARVNRTDHAQCIQALDAIFRIAEEAVGVPCEK